MKKVFYCKDLDILCDWKCIADTEDELLRIVAGHAAEKHGMKEMTEPMREQIVNAIKESD